MSGIRRSKMIGAISKWLVFAIILGLVLVGFYFDRMVAPAQEAEQIEQVFALLDKPTDDGKGLPKDTVQEAIGFAPEEIREVEGTVADLGTERGIVVRTGRGVEFEVETYRFERSVPFSSGQFVEVVYFNGAMFSVVVNDRFDPHDKRFQSIVAGTQGHDHNHSH